MEGFNVKIAGCVFWVCGTKHASTKGFFSDFLSNERAEAIIDVSEEEIRSFQEKLPHFTEALCERAVLKYRIDKYLVDQGAFPFHATALSYKDEAYVFTALSGVGKSTHARLWRDSFGEAVTMINDDRPYLKLVDRTVCAYSHPQSGKHHIYTNTSCPVRVIGRIIRDRDNYVRRLSGAEFFPFFVQQVFTMDDPETTSKIISLIMQVLSRVRVYEIHCNMDPTAGRQIYDQLDSDIRGRKGD